MGKRRKHRRERVPLLSKSPKKVAPKPQSQIFWLPVYSRAASKNFLLKIHKSASYILQFPYKLSPLNISYQSKSSLSLSLQHFCRHCSSSLVFKVFFTPTKAQIPLFSLFLTEKRPLLMFIPLFFLDFQLQKEFLFFSILAQKIDLLFFLN